MASLCPVWRRGLRILSVLRDVAWSLPCGPGPALGPPGSGVREWRVRSWLRASANILTCCCLPPWLARLLNFSGEPSTTQPALCLLQTLPWSQEQLPPRLPTRCARSLSPYSVSSPQVLHRGQPQLSPALPPGEPHQPYAWYQKPRFEPDVQSQTSGWTFPSGECGGPCPWSLLLSEPPPPTELQGRQEGSGKRPPATASLSVGHSLVTCDPPGDHIQVKDRDKDLRNCPLAFCSCGFPVTGMPSSAVCHAVWTLECIPTHCPASAPLVLGWGGGAGLPVR